MEGKLTIHLDLHFKETQVHLMNSPYTAKKSCTYTVGCQGVVELGVPAPRFVRGGHAKVGACKSILFTESFHMVKINIKFAHLRYLRNENEKINKIY